MNLFHFVLVLVALARVAELLHARRNTRRLLAEGAVEIGRSHYPLIVGLHLAWFAALLVVIPAETPPRWPWLILFALLQVARLWVLATLGRYWTTRIIHLPTAPLVQRGPYRFLRHPNYLIVELEIVILPLAFGAWLLALIFGIANAAILAWRIRIEETALASRRSLAA
ncbi:MAG TPA: isoprenylcysteine carboxylmethyltransferase family protein [Candidatus Polarisedimenticolia bacterium]|nr:isoprenylcysteine carboxylmethyltransferase family protein [Candidatus Polarisedimenticolia bacterium]